MTVDPTMEAEGALLGDIGFGGVGNAAIDALTGRQVMYSRHVHAEAAEASVGARLWGLDRRTEDEKDGRRYRAYS